MKQVPSSLGSLSPKQARTFVRRNTLLLAGGMAALYGMLELAVGTATLTFEAVGGSKSLAGFAPAVFLLASGMAAMPAGWAMDRYGRRPVLATGFSVGIAGSLSVAMGVYADSLYLVLFGFLLAGIAAGTVLLSRVAAADMYAPERRGHGVALILFGAVFGALLGPLVFVPIIGSTDVQSSALVLAWLGAAGFVLAGLIIISQLKPDPKQIARALGYDSIPGGDLVRPFSQIIKIPGVIPALLGSAASWAAMVPIMALIGSVLVGHGHSHSSIFPVIAFHFVGMFGLFPVVGRLVDKVGNMVSLVCGLFLLAASCAMTMIVAESVPLTAVTLLAVGLGWNLAFVAASSELSSLTRPDERGRLLGFTDLISGILSALLVIAGGFTLATFGLAAVSIAAAAIPIVPALWVLRVVLRQHRSRAGFLG